MAEHGDFLAQGNEVIPRAWLGRRESLQLTDQLGNLGLECSNLCLKLEYLADALEVHSSVCKFSDPTETLDVGVAVPAVPA